MTEDPRYTELSDEPLPVPPDPYIEREASRRRNSYLLVAMAAVVCVLGAVLAVNGLTGGSGGSPQAGTGSDEAGVAGTKQAAPTGTEDSSEPPADLVLFKSPSGNIGCALSTQGARCDIGDKEWKPPAKPADCDGDWGVGVSVAAKSAALVCATDTVLGQGKELAYGSDIERGDYRCDSSEDGMRCENTKTGHGFTIARAKYTTF